jgi:hypothetical protein
MSVVVVEAPASEARMHDMFKAVDAVLRTHPEVAPTTRPFEATARQRPIKRLFAPGRIFFGTL